MNKEHLKDKLEDLSWQIEIGNCKLPKTTQVLLLLYWGFQCNYKIEWWNNESFYIAGGWIKIYQEQDKWEIGVE